MEISIEVESCFLQCDTQKIMSVVNLLFRPYNASECAFDLLMGLL